MGGIYWFVVLVSTLYTVGTKLEYITDLQLDHKVHGFVGSALMFLLVFRSQASYKKWMDGLKVGSGSPAGNLSWHNCPRSTCVRGTRWLGCLGEQ